MRRGTETEVDVAAAAQPRKPSGRLDREAYFNAAFRILATDGFSNLTAEALCAELDVTRGSFYHHFSGMPEFVEALMQAWEQTVAEILAGWVAMDPIEAVGNVVTVLARWPFQAEAALRAWGWSNPGVAETVRRWDLSWEAANRAWLENVIDDPERCRVLAHMSHAVVVGMMSLQRPVDVNLVMAVMGELARVTLGVELVPDPTGEWFVPHFTSDEPA